MKKFHAAFLVTAVAFLFLSFLIQPAAADSGNISTKQAGGAKSKAGVKSETIDINTANLKTLLKLKGIGPKRAKSIIDYRSRNGVFKSTRELKKVKGIGDKIYSRIANRIRVK